MMSPGNPLAAPWRPRDRDEAESPPPSLAWRLQHALRKSLPPPSIFQPHDANVVKEPSALRSSTQSPSNACPRPAHPSCLVGVSLSLCPPSALQLFLCLLAVQLVAPPLLRCFPGNSRSGWQTR